MKIVKKVLDRHLGQVLKAHIKSYGYRMRDYSVFKEVSGFFVSALFWAGGWNGDEVGVRMDIKPYYFDDVFWEVIKMPTNSQAPVSLRAVGAFAVRSLSFFEKSRVIKEYDEVEGCVLEFLEACDVATREMLLKTGNNAQTFVEYTKTLEEPYLYYDLKLGEILLLIKQGDYPAAKEIALHELENHSTGYIRNEGKWTNEHVVEYCERMMESQSREAAQGD